MQNVDGKSTIVFNNDWNRTTRSTFSSDALPHLTKPMFESMERELRWFLTYGELEERCVHRCLWTLLTIAYMVSVALYFWGWCTFSLVSIGLLLFFTFQLYFDCVEFYKNVDLRLLYRARNLVDNRNKPYRNEFETRVVWALVTDERRVLRVEAQLAKRDIVPFRYCAYGWHCVWRACDHAVSTVMEILE